MKCEKQNFEGAGKNKFTCKYAFAENVQPPFSFIKSHMKCEPCTLLTSEMPLPQPSHTCTFSLTTHSKSDAI